MLLEWSILLQLTALPNFVHCLWLSSPLRCCHHGTCSSYKMGLRSTAGKKKRGHRKHCMRVGAPAADIHF